MSGAFSPQGDQVVAGFDYNMVKIWHVPSGRLLRTLTGPAGDWSARSVSFSPDGKYIVSTIDVPRIWDAATGRLVRAFSAGDKNASAGPVVFAPDGARVLTGDANEGLRLWDISSGRLIRVFKGHLGQIVSLSFSADGRRILSGSGELDDAAVEYRDRRAPGHAGGGP